MFKIGLTGGIGSGKSLACQYFRKRGITVIDADEIAKQLTTPAYPDIWSALKNHFGPSFFIEEELNRSALREHIFSDPSDKQWLENLLHPLISSEMHQQAEASHGPIVVLCIPLLAENQLQNTVDEVWVIDCEPSTQIARTMIRDPLCTEETVQEILKQQAPRATRLALADVIISNEGNIPLLEKNLSEQLEKLSSLKALK